MNKLLISHASADHSMVAPFIELLESVGIGEDSLIYTSYDNTGIPIRADFSKYLKEAFNSFNLHVVFMLSNNFYSRIMCLNEMGAVWVKDCSYDFVFLKGFNPSNDKFNQGALNPRAQGFSFDNETRLKEFINGLTSKFHIIDSNVEIRIQEYIVKVRHIYKEQYTIKTFPRPF